MKYYINVASKNHCLKGIEGGFIQSCHGKLWPLKKLQPEDKFILYASKIIFGEKASCQEFIAVGSITKDPSYETIINIKNQDQIFYRKDVIFEKNLEATSILLLIENLDFIVNKKNWSYKFLFGFFEISEKDFNLIYNNMKKN